MNKKQLKTWKAEQIEALDNYSGAITHGDACALYETSATVIEGICEWHECKGATAKRFGEALAGICSDDTAETLESTLAEFETAAAQFVAQLRKQGVNITGASLADANN